MTLLLLLPPFLLALAALALPSDRKRIWLLPPGAIIFACAVVGKLSRTAALDPSSAIAWDPAGRIVLLGVAPLNLAVAFYLVPYLRRRTELSNRLFVACALALPGILALVAGARNLGLMWVCVESAALCTVPLIYYNRTERAIEASWKYMLIGFVGIAMALLGTMFLAYASLHAGLSPSLEYGELLEQAPLLSKRWLRAAFVLTLVGYGTKMGLAPMHTWKPDAYGEAPGAVGALLAGAVTSAGFLGLLRINHICSAAGAQVFVSPLLIGMGLFSMLTAAIFLAGQRDAKRMLAFSSIEHMGILTIGLGFGKAALFGVLLHLVNNGLTKGVLFLSVANLHRSYGSLDTGSVRGALQRSPWSAILLLSGFLAIAGSPPFGPFISLFSIVQSGFAAGYSVATGVMLAVLLLVFVGMGSIVLRMTQGTAPGDIPDTKWRENPASVLPAAFLLLLILWFGLQIPAPVERLIGEAVAFLGDTL